MYLTAAEDKDRLELVRHKVRQIADLTSRLEALEKEKKELEQMLALRDSHIQELKEHVQHLMEKNHAKQEVIMALTEQMARELSDPLQEANTITAETLYKQQEEIEHLKVCGDDTSHLGAPISLPSGSAENQRVETREHVSLGVLSVSTSEAGWAHLVLIGFLKASRLVSASALCLLSLTSCPH